MPTGLTAVTAVISVALPPAATVLMVMVCSPRKQGRMKGPLVLGPVPIFFAAERLHATTAPMMLRLMGRCRRGPGAPAHRRGSIYGSGCPGQSVAECLRDHRCRIARPAHHLQTPGRRFPCCTAATLSTSNRCGPMVWLSPVDDPGCRSGSAATVLTA